MARCKTAKGAAVRFLGVDPGTKRVGLAISDPGESLAGPLKVLARRTLAQIVADIAALCRQEEIGGLVVGLPINMDGSHGPAAQEAEVLGKLLHEATGLVVEYWDERLSSVTAENAMLEADLSRAMRKRKIDKVAAQIILQGFLDSRNKRKD
jgi:putative Holliday junction resolvase